MKFLRIMLLLLASIVVKLAPAQTLNWKEVEKIPLGTLILVKTTQRTLCTLQRVTDDELFCRSSPASSHRPTQDKDLTFSRSDIQFVFTGESLKNETYDYSKGFFSLLGAFEAGGGFDSHHQPSSFAGLKIGGPISLDLQYDRLSGHSGFSVEGSGVLPLFRIPRYQWNRERRFVNFYAEPGLGYRAGDGPFGQYASAKVLAVLLDDRWLDNEASPYIELQRRFPFNSPLDGDNRIAIGVMLALCWHCGLD